MEITTSFEGIEDIIIADIKSAKEEILLAVVWFTNKRIFDVLTEKMESDKKFSAKLVVINDNINNRIGGIDFQKFISLGGVFFFAEKNIPMHNKYIVIDSKLVITGSYDYTYLAESINDENIIRIDGCCDIVQSYIDNFNTITSRMRPVKNIEDYITDYPPYFDMFSYNQYAVKDIYAQIQYLNGLGLIGDANKLQNSLSSDAANDQADSFVIYDVIYEQWKDDYYIDRIEAHRDEIIVKFRTTLDDSAWINAPGTRFVWFLCPSDNRALRKECYNIKNVCINNEIVLKQVTKGHLHYFYTEEQERTNWKDNDWGYKVNNKNEPIDDHGTIVPIEQIQVSKQDVLTCEVCFKIDNDELKNGIIDFVEGDDCEKKDNHWNAFKINMKLNREY